MAASDDHEAHIDAHQSMYAAFMGHKHKNHTQRLKRNFCREMLDRHIAEYGETTFDSIYRSFINQAFIAWKESMPMELFEYAAFYVATEKGDNSVIVVQPTTVLAKTEEVAKSLAARAIPEAYAHCLDKVTLVIRPFV